MIPSVALYCAAFLVLPPLSYTLAGDELPLKLQVSSVRSSYLLGEPVSLRVVVTNVSDRPIEIGQILSDEGTSNSEIIWFFSYEGGVFVKYKDALYQTETQERIFTLLQPDESQEYRTRLLYMRAHRSKLAFERSGKYTVKARYPLFTPLPGEEIKPDEFHLKRFPSFTRFNYQRQEIDSGTTQFSVQSPEGDDAEVWEVLRQEPYLRFLQVGWYPLHRGEDEIPQRLAELLTQYQKSAYKPAIRHALAVYYGAQLYRKNDPSKREQIERERAIIREVTEIKDEAIFPSDKRLDANVSVGFREPTPYRRVLEAFTLQTGVPLDAEPELKELKPMLVEDYPLRTVMKSHASLLKGKWERRGEGYFLSPQEELFPGDRLIDASVLIYYPQPTPVSEVLRFLSKSSRRKIEASPELTERRVNFAERNSVREIMRSLSDELHATWVRRGEGYFLTRNPAKGRGEPADEPSEN